MIFKFTSMQPNPLTVENSINSFIDSLRHTLAIAESNVPLDDLLLLDILLSLEHILDRSRVLFGTYVPTTNQVCTMQQLHSELDALREQIFIRLKALPISEAKSLLQSRLTEAGSSWWHVTKQ